jgi:hypothetical protein
MKSVRTKSELRAALASSLLALAGGLIHAQASVSDRAQVMLSSGELSSESAAKQQPGQLVREIDDPNLGDRWLLTRNEEAPGGPGRLVRVAARNSAADGESGESGGRVQISGQPTAVSALPVIRLGDRVIVEEHTAVLDARLEARALRPAAIGAVFEVRLAIGGHVVRVVARGPGRAELVPETEARP